jgi:hypothetical protein
VNDAVLVCAFERAHDGNHQLAELTGGRFRRDHVGERLALEILEHHVRQAVVLADLEDRDDVLVRAACGRARLDEEPLHELGVVAEQELDRDLAPELRVAAEEDLAHAAACDLADELEAADRGALREIERRVALAARGALADVGRSGCRCSDRSGRRGRGRVRWIAIDVRPCDLFVVVPGHACGIVPRMPR